MPQATLNGVLANDGFEACQCGFEYGDTPALGTSTALVAGLHTGDTFSQTIYGLVPGNTYYFRAKAINSVGTSYGATLSFGIPIPPVVAVPIEALKDIPSLYGSMCDDTILITLLGK